MKNISHIEHNPSLNLQFAEYHTTKKDRRGWSWVYPITKVADGKAKHVTKADVATARSWVDRMST